MRPLSTTEYAVLGTLAAGEGSGYDLARAAEWSVGAMWAPSKSQIYKVLPRLVDLGCARVREIPQETRPDKAVYSVTRHGRAALRAWVEDVEEDPQGGGPIFLMKVFFGWAAPPGAAELQLDAYEAWLRRRLERYEGMEDRLPDDEPVHSRVALRHALARVEATLAWAAEARALLAGVTAVLLLAVLAATPPSGRALDGCTPKAGDVSFRAADGIRLAGHVWGSGDVGVVLAHQSDGSVCEWRGYAARLARLGYRVLALDFRGYGESQSASFLASNRQGGDVAAAVRYLRGHGAKRVLLVGASLGGSAVIQAGANVRPHVDGVVAVSAADYLLDAPRSAARLTVPVLYVAGKLDGELAREARHLYSLTPSRAKSILIADSGWHGTQLVAESPVVRARIESFLYAKRSP
jgi:DNA-binding PadR family transcriptional regulator/dienelactone hydrolase